MSAHVSHAIFAFFLCFEQQVRVSAACSDCSNRRCRRLAALYVGLAKPGPGPETAVARRQPWGRLRPKVLMGSEGGAAIGMPVMAMMRDGDEADHPHHHQKALGDM